MSPYQKIALLDKLKLDKIPGKVLSDNNYSDEDKQKVAESINEAAAAAAAPVQSVSGKIGDVILDKTDVGLDQVDNTSDLDKPISNATQLALDALDEQIPQTGNPNAFAGYDPSGIITQFNEFQIDPNTFNGSRWFHHVEPAITDDFKTLQGMFAEFNPTVQSRQGWNHYFIEAGIGTDGSGNQFGDPTDVKSTLVFQDITYTSNRRGTDGDAISIEYIGGGTAGNEVVTRPGPFAFVVQIEDGVSTADQVQAALDLEQNGVISNEFFHAVTGVGSNPQVIGGPTNLSGGINDSGGITMMGLSLFSRQQSNVGFMNGYQSYLDFGNGTDAIIGKSWNAFGGNATIHDNSTIRFMSAFEYGFNVSDNNAKIEQDFRGVNIYGNLGEIGQGIGAFQFGINAKSFRFGNLFANFLHVSEDVEQGINVFADFGNYDGNIGGSYYGAAIQPNINSTDGFYGVNVSPNVALSRNQSVGLNVNMNNVVIFPGAKASVIVQDITYEAYNPGSDLNNPHSTTKSQVGLGNADNTSDINKPVSTAQGAAIADALASANNYTDVKVADIVNSAPSTLDTLKELADALGDDPNFATTTATALGNRLRVDTASQGLNTTQKNNAKTNIDLQNVDNTSDVNKPVSTAQAAADSAIQSNLDSHISNTSNPHTTTKAQVGLGNVDNTSDTNKPVSTAQAAADAVIQSDLNIHKADGANPHSTTKTQVGLSNVDNTSDLNKPISTATQSALDLKAPIASPTLTGVPAAPTASVGTNTTQLATTAFVNAAVAAGWQVGTVTTNSSGIATFTFPTAFGAGVVPIVMAIAVATVANNLYSVQLNSTPTNTSCQLKVNVIGGASISLVGLLSLNIFSAAPSGVVIHVAARAP